MLLLLLLPWFLLLLPSVWCYLHHLLHVLIHHLALQCRLGFIGTALCALVPFLSLPLTPLYLPPLLSGCAFLHR